MQTKTKIVKKKWGMERWIENNNLYCLKEMTLLKNACCSVHWHLKKDETFYVTVGRVLVMRSGLFYEMYPGDRIRIEPMISHSFWGAESSMFLEVSTHHDDNDVHRVTESKFEISESIWRGICRNP